MITDYLYKVLVLKPMAATPNFEGRELQRKDEGWGNFHAFYGVEYKKYKKCKINWYNAFYYNKFIDLCDS